METSAKLFTGNYLHLIDALPDQSIDHIITDPPYGITNNSWDSFLDLDVFWKRINRVLKPGGNVVVFASGPFSSKLMLSNLKDYKYKLIWKKNAATNFLNAKKQPLRIFEEILVFYNKLSVYNPQMLEGKPYKHSGRGEVPTGSSFGKTKKDHVTLNTGNRYPHDLLEFKLPSKRDEKLKHPTQKPLDLMEYLVRTYSNEGDTILDPFAGSGTTLLASRLHGRNSVGFEIDPTYSKIAQQRLNLNNGDI